jgi:hypothetical protein
LRGFKNLFSLFSLLAFLSALFSRIDLPTFLAAPLLGDFPDIGITPFHALRYPIPYLLLFFYPVLQKPRHAAPYARPCGVSERDRRSHAGFETVTQKQFFVFPVSAFNKSRKLQAVRHVLCPAQTVLPTYIGSDTI